MISVSPIKKITRLDRIQSCDLYRAVDSSGERPEYLSLCGSDVTSDIFWSWMGTKRQYRNLQKKYGWEFELVPVDRLRF